MAIPLPILDDRKWTDLVQEGRAQVPRYAPAWTDHNVHDPGITIMEFLAWRTEMSVYRLNRILPRHIRKYLELTGIENPGPLAAEVILTFGPLAVGSSFNLPPGVQFESRRIHTSSVPFAMTRGIHLERVTLAALLTHNAAGIWHDLSGETHDGHSVTIFGIPPQPNAAVYFGFEDLPSGVPISMGLWFEGPATDWAERSRIVAEVLAQRKACRPLHSNTLCPGATLDVDAPLFRPPQHHSARIVWEVATGPGAWTKLKHISMSNRPSIGEVADDTRSLTLDGIVEINVPASIAKVALGPNPTPLFYLRARLEKGGYDTPVIVRAAKPNSSYAVQSVPLWQTLPIKAGIVPVNPPPPIGTSAAVNFTTNLAGEIDSLTFLPAGASGVPTFLLLGYVAPGVNPGSITLELSILGRGTAVPMQQVFLPAAPVRVDTVHLYTHDGSAWTSWTHRDDFDSSLPSDRHFKLDPSLGTITFGDGNRGRTTPIDHMIVAIAEGTLADFGNVRARSINTVNESPQNTFYLSSLSAVDMLQLRQHVTNAYPAIDGAAEPSISKLALAATSALHAHERLTDLAAAYTQETLDQIPIQEVRSKQPPGNAINVVDIERIALDTPGTRISRVRAWPNHHPSLQCINVVGFITVVVIPDMPTPKPTPTQGLLDAIRQHLGLHRIVCMQVAVTGPTYIVISVTTSVKVKQGANSARVIDAIRHAIDAFLDARSGGPAGRGWPFGRSIYRSEVLQLIDDIPGVDHVISLSLTADSGTPQCGDIQLCNTWLPAPGTHTIRAS